MGQEKKDYLHFFPHLHPYHHHVEQYGEIPSQVELPGQILAIENTNDIKLVQPNQTCFIFTKKPVSLIINLGTVITYNHARHKPAMTVHTPFYSCSQFAF